MNAFLSGIQREKSVYIAKVMADLGLERRYDLLSLFDRLDFFNALYQALISIVSDEPQG